MHRIITWTRLRWATTWEKASQSCPLSPNYWRMPASWLLVRQYFMLEEERVRKGNDRQWVMYLYRTSRIIRHPWQLKKCHINRLSFLSRSFIELGSWQSLHYELGRSSMERWTGNVSCQKLPHMQPNFNPLIGKGDSVGGRRIKRRVSFCPKWSSTKVAIPAKFIF